MTELEPLVHSSSDELELDLLRSADGDEPAPAAFSRTAVALGLGGLTLSAASGAGAASGAAGGGAGAVVVGASIWVTALKALAIGATGGLIVSAGAQAVLSEPPREATATAAFDSSREKSHVEARQAPVVPAERVTAASRSETETTARPFDAFPTSSDAVTNSLPIQPRNQVRRDLTSDRAGAQNGTPSPANVNGAANDPGGLPALTTPSRAAFDPVVTARSGDSANPAHVPVAPSVSSGKTVARPQPAVSIAEEVRTLDRARQALSSGRARDALRELERYQSQWPRGVFASEVLVLRVEAKLKLGDRASAEREARALIDAQPKSRHAARLRALLGIAE